MNRFFSTSSTVLSGAGCLASDIGVVVVSFVAMLFSIVWMIAAWLLAREKAAQQKKPGA